MHQEMKGWGGVDWFGLLACTYMLTMPLWYVVFAVVAYRHVNADWQSHFGRPWDMAPYWAASLAVPMTFIWPIVVLVYLVGSVLLRLA